MDTTSPMDDQDDFTRLGIDIRDDLLNQCADDAFLQAYVRPGVVPDGLQIVCQILPFVCLHRPVSVLHARLGCQALFQVAYP
jgi:hypothetical protein